MTKKIKVYLDMDGVLVDFDEGLARKTTPLLNRVHAELARAEERLREKLPGEIEHFEHKNHGTIEKDQMLNRFVRSLKGTPLEGQPEAKAYKKLYSTAKGARVQVYGAPGYYIDLKPMSDMQELLSFVRTIDPNPSILTAPISGKLEAVEGCCQEKREWVKLHIPDFTGNVICDDKKFEYAKAEPNTVKILIDDRSKNTVPWEEAGGVAVLHTTAANTIAQLQKLKSKNLLETYVSQMVDLSLALNEETKKKVSYTGIILSNQSKNLLLSTLSIPEGWERVVHHMTINMGPFKGPRELIGRTVKLEAVTFAMNDKVMAVGVKSDIPSTNAVPHITVAVNRAKGAKPVMSNALVDWKPLTHPLSLEGTIQEVEQM
jgi:hypothetical protein